MKDDGKPEEPQKGSTAFIGTGPLSLLKACLLAEKNPHLKITLFDSGNQIGGAWYSDLSPKGHEIECGCHIWSYNPVAYDFIEHQLGVRLHPMKPNPVFVSSKMTLPYSLKNTIDTYRKFARHLLKMKWGRIKALNKMPDTHYKIFGKANRYPSLGSPRLIHALFKRVSENKQINVVLDTKVTSITVDDKVTLHSDKGNETFDQVYLTYVSHLEDINLHGKRYAVKSKRVDYIHFLLEFDKPLLKKISYWRLMNDPVVHTITDISYQTEYQENLILAGIKDRAFDAKKIGPITNHVLDLMKKYKLINSGYISKLIKVHVFPTYYMDQELIDALAKFPDQVRSLHTTDLMYGFHYLLRSETPHLIKTPR